MIINFANFGGGSGSGGTSNYNQLTNKPQINSVELTGNTSLDALDIPHKSQLENGELMAGMAKQIYSPTGIKTEATFVERTTAGNLSVGSGVAQLRSIEANTIAKQPVYDGFSSTVTDGHLTASFTGVPTSGYTGGTYTYTGSTWSPALPEGLTLTGTPVEGDVITVTLSDTKAERILSISAVDTTFTATTSEIWNAGGNGIGRHRLTRNSNAWFYRADLDTFQCSSLDSAGSWSCRWPTNGHGIIISETEGAKLVSGDYIDYVFYYVPIVTVTEASRTGHLTAAVNEATFQELHPESGTYPFTYSSTGWSEDLATNGISITGTPLIGDVISVYSTTKDYGTLSSATPTLFWATSMNIFNRDDANSYEANKTIDANGDIVASAGTYVVKIKTIGGLEDGYVAYSENSAITRVGIASSATATSVDLSGATQNPEVSVMYPTTAVSYVYIATSDINKLCVHPRWSGYNDKVYEAYGLSQVTIPTVDATGGTLPQFIAVGNTRNQYDFENKIYTQKVESIPATEELIQQYRYSKVWGTDYVFDDNHIYQVLQTPVVYNLAPETYQYLASDFGFEGFSGTTVPVKVSCLYYMENLVDKLRRDVITKDELVLDKIAKVTALPTTGVSDGTIYNYNDNLYRYKTSSGVCGEWFGFTQYGSYDSGCLAYAYHLFDYIPQNQIIAIFRYFTQQYTFFVKSDESIKVYSGTTSAITAATQINILQHNGNEVTIPTGTYETKVQWTDNVIYFRDKGEYVIIDTLNNPVIEGSHYENINLKIGDLFRENTSGIPLWGKDGKIISKRFDVYNKYYQINETYQYYLSHNYQSPVSFFAPTAAGNSGQILKSNGSGAPTWDNPANLIGGVTFWTGTQDEYDALATKSNSVVYLIKEDE